MSTVAVIVGSLRRDSLNLRFAKALARLAQGSLAFEIIVPAELPMYNEDLWERPPDSVLRLKRDVEAADAVLFITPEYNRSFSGVIKNAIDWGSRPSGKSSWAGKPGAVVGTSPGAIGTAVAQSQLRSVLLSCGVNLLTRSEVCLVSRPDLISDTFEVTDAKTRELLSGFVARFTSHIERGVER